MDTRHLGRSGLKVSAICLGTMAFGRWIDERASAAVIDAALDAGITFFDTADVYGRGMDNGNDEQKGESEAILGRLLGARRQRIVLATKVYGRMGPGPTDAGLSRAHIMAAAEASLKRLQTDYIDLYQCHRFDDETPLEETLRAFDDLVRQGKVRYIGCSNFAAWQIAKAHGISAAESLVRFISVQPQYSLLVRDIESELVPFCRSEGVGVIPYSPLARGMLTGKYRLGAAPPSGTRAAAGEPRLHALMTEANFAKVERLRALSDAWGIPMAHLGVAWVLANPAVSAAIVGASRPEQIAEATKAAELQLEPEQKRALDALGA